MRPVKFPTDFTCWFPQSLLWHHLPVLPERQEVRVAEIKHTLIQCGALGATMSGTGPTAFGLFQRKELAEEACALLSEQNRDTFLAETV